MAKGHSNNGQINRVAKHLTTQDIVDATRRACARKHLLIHICCVAACLAGVGFGIDSRWRSMRAEAFRDGYRDQERKNFNAMMDRVSFALSHNMLVEGMTAMRNLADMPMDDAKKQEAFCNAYDRATKLSREKMP